MFRTSEIETQLNMFSNIAGLLPKGSSNHYQNPRAWHNLFRNEVLMRIDESVFCDLFDKQMGAPNASLRVLTGMMSLKEAFGWSDSQLFEQCQFNLLVQSALGIFNLNEGFPSESTYYLFRRRLHEYQKATNIDLMEKAFVSVTTSQVKQFEVNGRSIRMDSKLIGSNIAWCSRYEIVHQTMSLFYQNLTDIARLKLTSTEKNLLETISTEEGIKVTYRSTREEVYSKLQILGTTIYRLVLNFNGSDSKYYEPLKRVFEEQYQQTEVDKTELRPKDEIKSDSLQSPHDKDCSYRNKDGKQVKGYSVNVTETCDDGSLNLITNIQVEPANAPDNGFVRGAIEQTIDILGKSPSIVHADGAYNSPENVDYCKSETMELCVNGIQGPKGQYDLNLTPEGLMVTDNNTGLTQRAKAGKKGKWSIRTEKGYRYFCQQEIETCARRKDIMQMPSHKRNKRNNVEATIFQLSFHTRNNKIRYRDIIKTKSWALLRSLWINLVRIKNFMEQICQRTQKSVQIVAKNCFFTFKTHFFSISELIHQLCASSNILFRFILNRCSFVNLYF
jgi:hypothetical protein